MSSGRASRRRSDLTSDREADDGPAATRINLVETRKVNRSALQKLAEDRLFDAKTLLDAGRWSGAYYLAGYAVECALKSCILHRIERTGFIFEDKKYAEKCWTHSVKDLVALADLAIPRAIANESNADLGTNWSIVEAWNELSRYRETDEINAATLYNAIWNPTDGVLPWIKNHW